MNCFFLIHSNPNNVSDEYLTSMIWPKHTLNEEFYMDFGTHFVEKHGLFLERYAVWDALDNSSGFALKAGSFFVLTLLTSILSNIYFH